MATAPDERIRAASLCNLTLAEYHNYNLRTNSASYESAPMGKFVDAVTRQYGPDGTWSVELAKTLGLHAHIYLAIAAEHLRSLETLLTSSSNSLPWGPAARSVAESSGRVIWLLDNRLTINRGGARRRVARYLLDSEENHRVQKRLSYAFEHPDRAKHGDAARQAKDLIRKPGVFYNSEIDINPKTGAVKLCGEVLPGPSKLVRVAAEVFGDDLAEASGIYGYLSAMTHPTVFAFIETLSEMTQLPDGSNYVPFRDDGKFALTVASNTTRAFYNAWRTWISWTDTGLLEANAVHNAHRLVNRRSDT